jgi:cytochrome c oxidase subunit IV
MSLQEAAAAGAAVHSHEETVTGTGHAHPSDRSYVLIAVLLALITAAEVATFYLEDELGGVLIPALVVMMVVKFATVAGWFMHLRFDSNLFTRLFVSGILLAVSVYLAMLAAFEFFSSHGEPGPAIPVEEEARR